MRRSELEETERQFAAFEREEDELRSEFLSDGVIDQEEQELLDEVRENIDILSPFVKRSRLAFDQAESNWNSRQQEYALSMARYDELANWGHGEASTLAPMIDETNGAAQDEDFEQALTFLDQFLTNLEPVHQDYLAQRAAEDSYRPLRDDFNRRLDGLVAGQYASPAVTGLMDQIAITAPNIDQSVMNNDFIEALEGLRAAMSDLAAAESAAVAIDELREQYTSQLPDIRAKIDEARGSSMVEIHEVLPEIVEELHRIEEAAGVDDYETALTLLAPLQMQVGGLAVREAQISDLIAVAHNKLDDFISKDDVIQRWRSERTQRVIEDLITKRNAYAAMINEQDFENEPRLWQDLYASEEAFRAAILDEQTHNRVVLAMEELEPRLARATTDQYPALADRQSEISHAADILRKTVADGNWTVAEDEIGWLGRKLYEFEAAFNDEQNAEAEYQRQLSEIRAAIADFFPGHDDTSGELYNHKQQILIEDTAMEAAAAQKDWARAFEFMERIDQILIEVHQINGSILRQPDIEAATNGAIRQILIGSRNSFETELNSGWINFESYVKNQVDSNDDAGFISAIADAASDVISIVAEKSPLWIFVGIGGKTIVSILSGKVDEDASTKKMMKQMRANVSLMITEMKSKFDNEMPERLMSKQPRLWDPLAEIMSLNPIGGQTGAQDQIAERLYSMGLPRPGSGIGAQMYKKMLGEFLVWEHDQELMHRLNDHRGYVDEPEIRETIDREFEAHYGTEQDGEEDE